MEICKHEWRTRRANVPALYPTKEGRELVLGNYQECVMLCAAKNIGRFLPDNPKLRAIPCRRIEKFEAW